jgi:hypothetical protein
MKDLFYNPNIYSLAWFGELDFQILLDKFTCRSFLAKSFTMV